MPAAVATPTSPVDPVDQVVSWRLAQLRRAGYPAREAVLISKCVEVDLHIAVDLADRGCPIDVALRILL